MPRRLADMAETRMFLTTIVENEDCDCDWRFTWKLRKKNPCKKYETYKEIVA